MPDWSPESRRDAAPVKTPGSGDPDATAGPAELQNAGWIADYRILRRLGEGGMGIVFEAEQKSPHRLVALKVIRGGPLVSEHQVRQFQREAQALGQLDHPGIAAIYEAGRTEDGNHYFAMELVRGVPFDVYLREHPLRPPVGRGDIQTRLLLFLQICDVVNYAHLRGIIHRDLKPSNIMVQAGTPSDSKGVPAVKVLDFGLARITNVDTFATTTITDIGVLQGTLAYMSPEQTRGDPSGIDIRSDVYSLGVILYEMLTGELPIAIPRTAVPAAVRAICEEPPRRPSSSVAVLRGDLETILLKTLEKDPGRRYQSVFNLADDIRRFVAKQPILAHPPSTAYQLRKLLVRHKGPFAFAATVAVLLVAFAITMSVMFGIQTYERARAEREAAKAQSVSSFLQQMLGSVNPTVAQGREVTVADVLAEASARVNTEFADYPEVRAAMHRTIGNTYDGIGRPELAREHLETALLIYREVLGPEHPEVAQILTDLALALSYRGHNERAEAMAREALAISEKSFGERHGDVARALSGVAVIVEAQGRLKEAEPIYRRALGIYRETERDGIETATAMGNLTKNLREQGNHEEAEALERESIGIIRRRLGENHPLYEDGLSRLATVLNAQGKTDEAVQLARECVAIARRIYGPDHTDLAIRLNNLSVMLGGMGPSLESVEVIREALAIRRRNLPADHPDIAFSLNNLGEALHGLGQWEEAEQHLREALALRRKIHGDVHPNTLATLNNLGTLMDHRDRLDEAEMFLREALAARRAIYGERSNNASTGMNNLANLLRKRKLYTEAEAMLRDAVAIRREALGNEHYRVGVALLNLGLVLRDQKKFDAAESALREALEISRKSRGSEHPEVVIALESLGITHLMQGAPERAEPLLQECAEIARKAFPAGHWRMASAVASWGRCLLALERFAEAEPLLLESYAMLSESLGADSERTQSAKATLAELYLALGKPERAAALR